MRPASIIQFERLYLGSLVVGLIATGLAWRGNIERLASSATTASVSGWFQQASTGLTIIITLALWYFIARRGSRVAKWIMVVLTGIGVLLAIGAVLTLVSGHSPNAIATLLSVGATILAVAAAAMLFRPDAQVFLGEGLPLDPAEPLA